MIPFKSYIAERLIGRKLRFNCDCIFPIDGTGVIVGFKMISNEIIFLVDVGGKIVSIGENHPNLYVEET